MRICNNPNIRVSILFLLIVLFTFHDLVSQNIIRGKIVDANSGEPISFADVLVSGMKLGATTDLDGFYNLTGLNPGTYILYTNYLGYDSSSVSVTLGNNTVLVQNFYIKPKGILLGAVEVASKRQAARTEVGVS